MEVVEGVGIASGIAIGEVLLLLDEETVVFKENIDADQVEAETKRFDEAIDEARKQISAIKDQVSNKIGEEHAFIFEAHLLFLDDQGLIKETKQYIASHHCKAQWAFNQVLLSLLQQFDELGDPYFVERGKDLEDVGKRILKILKGDDPFGFQNLNQDIIIVGSEFGPSNITTFDNPNILGFATDLGGQTTHTAIIAKALGLPAVLGLHDISHRVNSGDIIILDSIKGKVVINPDAKTLAEYRKSKAAYKRDIARYIKATEKDAITKDGQSVSLLANIEIPHEAESAMKFGARGIGLYRTEFLFLHYAPDFPSEDIHYETYCQIAGHVAPEPVTIRTLDLGGEKFFHRAFVKEKELNPVMGLRGVRLCLFRKDIFRTQLRGLLRAAALHANIRVMFPLITSVDEFKTVRAFVSSVADEMQAEGQNIRRNLDLGVMIEVPSAALVADHLAAEVDFFSIGSNDLIQYFLAIDRANDDVNYLYDPFHPGVIRLLKHIIDEGHRAGIDVSCCGEMASSPLYAALLMHLGLTNLSMNPASVPTIHHLVRELNLSELRRLVPEPTSFMTGDAARTAFKQGLRNLLKVKSYKHLIENQGRKAT
ncbi:MAG: phosphoenolpyruvate--protein phosphotransferase [Acidobacteria bacterium]|nr:phosphoenolpyruvate--protein phosphotransferase [Acidobacteriota bacterium]